jgi:hypothetical protein
MNKCNTCGEQIKANCDWHQGRCPHRHPMFDEILFDNYKMRYYNLIQSIKKLFK